MEISHAVLLFGIPLSLALVPDPLGRCDGHGQGSERQKFEYHSALVERTVGVLFPTVRTGGNLRYSNRFDLEL
jgi:hypothetical protein